MPNKIMLIRHAERPDPAIGIRGVALDGKKEKESLSVRGWQRAGALARLFAPFDDCAPAQSLSKPAALYACKAAPEDPSLRPQHTLIPLAELLGATVNSDHFRGHESALLEAVAAGEGPALIAWKHDRMHAIANAILGDDVTAPQHWPYSRYDLVWVFDRVGDGWTFSQVPQLLLAGDSAEPIA